MAQIHRLIIDYGIEETRRQAVSKHDRLVIETAHRVLSDDAEKMGFTYSGFALTSLPHKPQIELVWRRDGHNITMLIESGRDRTGKPLGLPYGSYARFILLFLQSEAIRTRSREIELGRSMRVWLGNMGLSIGGTTYKLVTAQARRISGCTLTFFADRAGAQIKSRGGFVKTEITMSSRIDDEQQAQLWQDRVLLDEDFYRALCEHPVPVSKSGSPRHWAAQHGNRRLYLARLPPAFPHAGYRCQLARPLCPVRRRIQPDKTLPSAFCRLLGAGACCLSGGAHQRIRPIRHLASLATGHCQALKGAPKLHMHQNTQHSCRIFLTGPPGDSTPPRAVGRLVMARCIDCDQPQLTCDHAVFACSDQSA